MKTEIKVKPEGDKPCMSSQGLWMIKQLKEVFHQDRGLAQCACQTVSCGSDEDDCLCEAEYSPPKVFMS